MSPGTTKQATSARNKLWTEVWAGRFEREDTCEACGETERPPFTVTEAHHDDYSKPLDVRWLCKSCHTKHHVTLRKAEGTYIPGIADPPAKKRERAA